MIALSEAQFLRGLPVQGRLSKWHKSDDNNNRYLGEEEWLLLYIYIECVDISGDDVVISPTRTVHGTTAQQLLVSSSTASTSSLGPKYYT